jgi:hypothetical protein
MRVKVIEMIDDGCASTSEAGVRLYRLIEPVLARGEEVVVDFDGVKHCAAVFFSASLASFVRHDEGPRLPPLLRYENLDPQWQPALQLAIDVAARRRDDPRWAAAYAEAARKVFGSEDWD